MFAAIDGGDAYTFAEIREGLAVAGFTDVRLIRQGEEMDGIVAAQKPV
jgi:hypothetical protein